MSSSKSITNIKLNLPRCEIDLKYTNNETYVFDVIRKKWILLTQEEWVRQHFIHYLIGLGYSKNYISVEREFKINTLKMRTDIVIYDPFVKPKVIIECKRSDFTINKETFLQITKYNMRLDVKYLVITNGIDHYYFQIDYQNNKINTIQELPKYDQL